MMKHVPNHMKQVTVRISKSEETVSEKEWINDLTTHLPDQVVYADHQKQLPFQKTNQGVLMFLDISGFTALTEKYSMNSRTGTDALTKTLNGYMEALVGEIISNDGDILKFAGDAILTLWQVENFMMMKVTVAHVIKCALSVQHKYGSWMTGVGVKLKIKIAISAGEVNVTYLGNNEFCHYVTMGRAVESVKVAEKFCKSGDVVIAPSVWCHCAGLPLEKETLSDKKHIKVTQLYGASIADNYEAVRTEVVSESRANLLGVSSPVDASALSNLPKRSIRDLSKEKSGETVSAISSTAHEDSIKRKEVFMPVAGMAGAMKKFGTSIAGAAKKNFLTEDSEAIMEHGILSEEFIARKAISEKMTARIIQKVRLYVAQPVLKKLDENQPLEYLCEMRQVTIVFINLQMKDCNKLELCQTLQRAFTTIYYHIKRLQGCLNKIFMFDKGCTFLGIFGLPGFKHEKDCMHALLCAYRMKKQLDEIPKLAQASIGVTTGSTFCGVVGHAHRHEYTVIGRKVNIAARLMMHYPGKVTCDNDTYHHSKLHKSNFFVLEHKEMKGLQNIGTIREFVETTGDRGTMAALQQKEYENPLIGREGEMNLFVQHLLQLKGKGPPNLNLQSQVLVFDGEAGIGKSRMLEAVMVAALNMDVKVVSCTQSMTESRTPFYAVKNLMMDLLDFDFEMPHQEREQSLYKRFKDPFVVENMCLLNDLLHIKLPQNEKFKSMDGKERSKWLHELLLHIVHELTNSIGVILFAVDDAHFMDPESWEFVAVLGNDVKSLVCLTLKLGSNTNLCDVAQQVLKLPSTVHIHMAGLDKCFITPLACQLMGVQKIPRRLEVFLEEKSHGVPSWCSQMLLELLHENILDICSVNPNMMDSEAMVSPPGYYMQRRRRTSKEVYSDMDKEAETQTAVQVAEAMFNPGTESTTLHCIIRTGCNLDRSIPDSVKGMIQARIDRMEELEQLIIKSAAVLGTTLSRDMLYSVLPARGEQASVVNFSKALHKLLSSGIFHCAISARQIGSNLVAHQREQREEECACPQDPHFPQSRSCRLLTFQSSSLQETAYEMLLQDLRQNLHKKAAIYLEKQAHKCEACGGGGFFAEHMVDKESIETLDSPRRGSAERRMSVSTTHRRLSLWKAVPSRIKRTITSLGELEANAPNTSMAPVQPPTKQDSFALSHITNASVRPSIGSATTRRGSMFAHAMESAFKAREHAAVGPQAEETLEKVFTCDSSDSFTDSNCQLDSIDLRECECMQILSRVYPQLVRHWRSAGKVRQTVHFLMEAAAAAIAVYDNMQALSYLREASKIIEDMKNNKNPFEEVNGTELFKMSEWEEARLESLIGQAFFQMGQMEESLPHFHRALTILGDKQPSSCLGVVLRIIKEGFRQWRTNASPITHTDLLPKLHLFQGRKGNLLVHRKAEVARCLSYLFHHSLFTSNDKLALACVLQQINRSEEANSDLYELLISYTCMMELCQAKAWVGMGRLYEYKALLRCMSCMDVMTPEHLGAISHLYRTSINMRLSWGFIRDAIDSGYTANRITQKLHDNDVRIHVLPVLVQALLLANRVADAVVVLQDLEFLLDESEDIIGQAWYYTGLFDLLLEYGVYMDKHEKCITFVKENYNSPKFISDHLPVYYLSACLTLWHSRRGEHAVADKWRSVCVDNQPSGLHNYMAVRAYMKLLEAKLIKLSYEIHNDARHTVKQIKIAVKQRFNVIKKMLRNLPVFEARTHHLQAYRQILENHMIKADYLLNKCVSLSNRESNILELQWASHSMDMWFAPDGMPDNINMWCQMSSGANKMEWHQIEQMEGSSSHIMYTLPLPAWHDL